MKKKIISISLLILSIAIMIIGMYYFFKSEVQATEAIEAKASASGDALSSPKLISGSNPNGYQYNTHTGTWEATSAPNLGIPVHGNFQIYCIQHPGPVSISGIPVATAHSLDGKSYTLSCGQHASTPYDGELSRPEYHEIETGKLSLAAAYVVSHTPIGQWSEEKQHAIWNLGLAGELGVTYEGTQGADSELADIAREFEKYAEGIQSTGFKAENKTNVDNVYTKVSQTRGTYTVGPFNVDYTNTISGKWGDSNYVAFGGISEMYVVGHKRDGSVVTNLGGATDGSGDATFKIKIDKFILKDSVTGLYGSSGARTPEFFEADSKLLIDTSEQVYPEPGQDFEVVFTPPSASEYMTAAQIASINTDHSEDYYDNVIVNYTIKVKFQYMMAGGQYTKLKGVKYQVNYSHNHSYNPHLHHSGCHKKSNGGTCHHYVTRYGCKTTCYLTTIDQQYLMAADAARGLYELELEMMVKNPIVPTMDLGGHVWEDGVATKETKADGVSNTSGDNIDRPLKNVKVTLYYSNGTMVPMSGSDMSGGRVNPTYTNENGNYIFTGLSSMSKYYVTFEYNGQVYLPTEYLNTANKQYSSVQQMVNAGLYNTDSWKVTSKGTETVNDRNNYDKKFAEIGSYPENYTSSNSLGKTGTKNATFSQKDLMGYTLDTNGKYKQTGTQLIDGYLYDENGNETTTYKDGVISQKVREYVSKNKKFPDTAAMKSIYSSIAGNNTETWRKLQFIEDCKIVSYTQAQGKSHDLYPVYDNFIINRPNGSGSYSSPEAAQNGTYPMNAPTIDGITYKPIYPGQFFVNQGLWRRQEYDSAVRKDVYRAVMKINNKTVMYKYDKRSDDDKYWDINVRMSDYDAYYGTGYNREVYKTDYEYSSKDLNHPGADLEIYVTYKITIRNQSQSIMTQIRELVDYYDKDYTYRDDLSWVTYIDGNKKNTVSDKEYYNAMVAEDTSKIANARETKAGKTSRYGSSTHSDITKTYNAVYIKGLESKKLATGESAYIYLTFQVNKQNGKVILDDESSPKMNYAEINGYTTYYKDGTSLPNGVTKNSSNVAGLLDRDSNPGNLVQSDINDKDKYEKNFEDDTDRAKALRIIIDEEAVRKANGTVWEDERTVKSGDSIIGDGIRQNKETKIAGVTVQLVEKTIDGKEYIWQETTTDSKGYYSFESYIPGDYVIRFYYGNNVSNTKINGNNDYTAGGQNDTSYNGQDFKSTTYQKEITQSNYTDESNRYTGYKNVTTQNETGTYGYDIYAADSNSSNVSDAKDLWSVSNRFAITYKPNATISEKKAIQGRQTVINYSNQNVTNHKAEVLASPYETPSYNGTKYTTSEMDGLINELMNQTYMTAETGVIAVEFEYDRQQTDGLKSTNNSGVVQNSNNNQQNGNYTLANIDLGLTERPKAQLEIDKSITNVKVTLANGSILFDVNKAGDNVIWKDHTEYNLGSKKDSKGKYKEYYGENGKNRYSYREEVDKLVSKSDKGLIQLTMDEELMHGATIEISYKVKVTNVGEVDYEGQKYYYLGDSSGATKVTTVANQVIDYVANNLQFNSENTANEKWNIINNNTLITSATGDVDTNLVNRRLANNVKQYNNVIETTDGLNKVLKPGESTDEKTLILTQLISTENKSDDLTYSNMVEIVKTSNTVGRRMAYSVVGNQDPTADKASEVDSSIAEKVIILPPFGDTHIFYVLGAVIAVILIGGIVFIIRKVLKK